MKYLKTFSTLAVAVLLASCTPQVDSDKYLIEGCLKSTPDSVVIKLFAQNDGRLSRVSEDTVFDGRFSFSDTISDVKQLFLVFFDDRFVPVKFPVWVAPGKYVRVSGEDNVHLTWKVTSDLAEQNDQNTLQEYVVDACREFTSLYLEAVATKKQWMAKMGEDINDSVLLEKYRSLDATAMQVLTRKMEAEIECMATMPRSRVWMTTLLEYAMIANVNPESLPNSEGQKALYNTLPEEVKQSEEGKSIYQFLYPVKSVEVGDEMADATLYDVDGGTHTLSELAGRYILLDFWTTGCGWCIKSFPELKDISRVYVDRLAVVSLSLDTKPVWTEYVRKNALEGHQWNELAPNFTGLMARYNINRFPYFVLINPEGKVIAKWSGYGEGLLWKNVKMYLK